MKVKNIIIKMTILILVLFCMGGCGRDDARVNGIEKQKDAGLQEADEISGNIEEVGESEDVAETEKRGETENPEEAEELEEPETNGKTEVRSAVKEIPVDFPFYESEPYSLTLAQLKEPDGEYELRLYDEDRKILQQIPCGSLTEPITFSYNVLYNGIISELEIFPADCDTGLFLEWKRDSDRFSENPVEILKYVETRYGSMLTVEENDKIQVKKIYQLNRERESVYESRLWELQKDAGKLIIWDDFENQSLFEGTVYLDEEGKPVNEEYYDMLFWEGRYFLRDGQEDSTAISAWIDAPREESDGDAAGLEGFEWAQREVFGNDGHGEEYKSREEFLAEFGFLDSVPMFQYYDQYDNLQLELFGDEASERFCGISYNYSFDSERKKFAYMYGFTINTVQEQKWEERTPFCTETVYGDDVADYVRDVEEFIEYTPSGQPDYFRIEGWKEQEIDGEIKDVLTKVLEINYVYRDDGTLFCRDYWHDSYSFGSTLCSLESFYDEAGRVVYEDGYITHGSLEYYYIYDGKRKKPKYCLVFDNNLGYVIPGLVRYY